MVNVFLSAVAGRVKRIVINCPPRSNIAYSSQWDVTHEINFVLFFPVGSLWSGGFVLINKTDMCCSLQNFPFICYVPAMLCEMPKCSLLYLMVFKFMRCFTWVCILRRKFYNITQMSTQTLILEFNITVTFFVSY